MVSNVPVASARHAPRAVGVNRPVNTDALYYSVEWLTHDTRRDESCGEIGTKRDMIQPSAGESCPSASRREHMTPLSLFRCLRAGALTILIALPVGMGGGNQQPLEGFLGHIVQEMGHPK
jgi:hypothetical protein